MTRSRSGPDAWEMLDWSCSSPEKADAPDRLRPRLMIPDLVEQRREFGELAPRETGEDFVVERVDRRVELPEELPAGRRDADPDLATIAFEAVALDQLLLLEPVDQPRDPRRLFHHPLDDLERRQAGHARAAQDPQHVVLLQRDPV